MRRTARVTDRARRFGARPLVRYGGVSALALGISQSALALSYGVLHTSVPVAVGIALAVSVFPSYRLNRRFVWPGKPASGLRTEITAFVLIGIAGSALTAVLASAGEAFARAVTHNPVVLTGVVNGLALLATIAVWLMRFAVLDQFLFAPVSTSPGATDVRPG